MRPTMEAGDAKETPVIVLSGSDCSDDDVPGSPFGESSASSSSLKTTPGASPVTVEEAG